MTAKLKDDLRAKATEIVCARGYRSLPHAARAVDLDATTMNRVLKHGVTTSSRQRTIDALRQLGLLDLFQRPSNGRAVVTG